MILVTRPLDLSNQTASKLREMGHKVIIHPLLEIKQRHDFMVPYSADNVFIITSQNSISAILKIQKDCYDLSIPIYVVGDRTARVLQQNGFKNIYSAAGTAIELIRLIKNQVPKTKKLIYISGSHVAGNIFSELSEDGYDIEQAIVYDSVFVDDIPHHIMQGITHIMFFSCRTAQSFLRIYNQNKYKLSDIKALCISKNVAEVIVDCDWEEIIISSQPSEKFMLDLL